MVEVQEIFWGYCKVFARDELERNLLLALIDKENYKAKFDELSFESNLARFPYLVNYLVSQRLLPADESKRLEVINFYNQLEQLLLQNKSEDEINKVYQEICRKLMYPKDYLSKTL